MSRFDELTQIREAQARSLRAAMSIAGITGAELARELHVSQSTVYTWTAARSSPSAAQARAISDALGMTIDEAFSAGAPAPSSAGELSELARAIERLSEMEPERRMSALREFGLDGEGEPEGEAPDEGE